MHIVLFLFLGGQMADVCGNHRRITIATVIEQRLSKVAVEEISDIAQRSDVLAGALVFSCTFASHYFIGNILQLLAGQGREVGLFNHTPDREPADQILVVKPVKVLATVDARVTLAALQAKVIGLLESEDRAFRRDLSIGGYAGEPPMGDDAFLAWLPVVEGNCARLPKDIAHASLVGRDIEHVKLLIAPDGGAPEGVEGKRSGGDHVGAAKSDGGRKICVGCLSTG
ncbi:hypothetical protein ASD00_27170 [Ensifer sp. Root31]|nr:hypothetical protein ASD00_27170 [Ensifer sp. Root31]